MGKGDALNLITSYLVDKTDNAPVEFVCAVKLQELMKEERYKTFTQATQTFAHLAKKRLIALLKDAQVWQEQYEEAMAQIREMLTLQDLC